MPTDFTISQEEGRCLVKLANCLEKNSKKTLGGRKCIILCDASLSKDGQHGGIGYVVIFPKAIYFSGQCIQASVEQSKMKIHELEHSAVETAFKFAKDIKQCPTLIVQDNKHSIRRTKPKQQSEPLHGRAITLHPRAREFQGTLFQPHILPAFDVADRLSRYCRTEETDVSQQFVRNSIKEKPKEPKVKSLAQPRPPENVAQAPESAVSIESINAQHVSGPQRKKLKSNLRKYINRNPAAEDAAIFLSQTQEHYVITYYDASGATLLSGEFAGFEDIAKKVQELASDKNTRLYCSPFQWGQLGLPGERITHESINQHDQSQESYIKLGNEHIKRKPTHANLYITAEELGFGGPAM